MGYGNGNRVKYTQQSQERKHHLLVSYQLLQAISKRVPTGSDMQGVKLSTPSKVCLPAVEDGDQQPTQMKLLYIPHV